MRGKDLRKDRIRVLTPCPALLGRSLHSSGPQFSSLRDKRPRLDNPLICCKFRNPSMRCVAVSHFNLMGLIY